MNNRQSSFSQQDSPSQSGNTTNLLQMHPYQYLNQLNTIFSHCNKSCTKSYSTVSKIKLPWKQFNLIKIPAYFQLSNPDNANINNKNKMKVIKQDEDQNQKKFWKQHQQIISRYAKNRKQQQLLKMQKRYNNKIRPHTAKLNNNNNNNNSNISQLQYTRSPMGDISNHIFLKRILDKGANLTYDKQKLKQEVLEKLKSINQQTTTNSNSNNAVNRKVNCRKSMSNSNARTNNNNNNSNSNSNIGLDTHMLNSININSINASRVHLQKGGRRTVESAAKSTKIFRPSKDKSNTVGSYINKQNTIINMKNMKKMSKTKSSFNTNIIAKISKTSTNKDSNQSSKIQSFPQQMINQNNGIRGKFQYEIKPKIRVSDTDYLHYEKSQQILANYRSKIRQVDCSISQYNVKKTISLLKSLQEVAENLD